jgi:hypothetical protein
LVESSSPGDLRPDEGSDEVDSDEFELEDEDSLDDSVSEARLLTKKEFRWSQCLMMAWRT